MEAQNIHPIVYERPSAKSILGIIAFNLIQIGLMITNLNMIFGLMFLTHLGFYVLGTAFHLAGIASSIVFVVSYLRASLICWRVHKREKIDPEIDASKEVLDRLSRIFPFSYYPRLAQFSHKFDHPGGDPDFFYFFGPLFSFILSCYVPTLGQQIVCSWGIIESRCEGVGEPGAWLRDFQASVQRFFQRNLDS